MNCKNCQKETVNPNFCSRSCSSSYNNRLKPKRKPEHQCKSCQAPVTHRKFYCENCKSQRENLQREVKDSMTLEQAIYIKHHRSSAYALIRTRARAIAKRLGWKACVNCSYNKHIEVAHIKPISSFDKTTTLSIVNHPSNLLALCPNCHWEYDHK